jgi:ABC-type sulfate transport system permease component
MSVSKKKNYSILLQFLTTTALAYFFVSLVTIWQRVGHILHSVSKSVEMYATDNKYFFD